jgi:hypothetical protein
MVAAAALVPDAFVRSLNEGKVRGVCVAPSRAIGGGGSGD